jgi:hypothetical protein
MDAAMPKIWVSSKTKKAVHLVDRTIVTNGDYQRVDITNRMGEENIPIRVFKTAFIQSYYTEPINLLEHWTDEDAAQKKYNEFFKIVAVEKQEAQEAKKVEVKIQDESIKVALKAYADELEKQKAKQQAESGKPKVIRKKREG